MARIFTADEHQRIDAAIAAVEQRSGADLELVVTPVSDRYPLYPILWAAMIALIVEILLALLFPELPVRRAVIYQLGVLIVAMLPLQWMPIRLALVPQRVKIAHARSLARREFAAGASGPGHPGRILLFVSIGERYVEIIADRETHASAPEDTWDKLVAGFVGKVRGGRLASGVLDAIEGCAAVLERHHPAQK